MRQPTAAVPQILVLLLPMLIAPAWLTPIARAQPAGITAPSQPTPILPLDQVRIGMKGYGLSVFHGVAIEPFPLEVMSIARDSNKTPRHAVIWIRCTDARMQQSGAVQGMSGSPIFLWGADEPQTVGKGGKLIGAFAFGYESALDCYVGVQPIEYMREVATRVDMGRGKTAAGTAGAGALNTGADQSASLSAAATLQQLLDSPATAQLPTQATWRARALQRLLGSPAERAMTPEARGTGEHSSPAGADGHMRRLLLPLAVGSARISALTAPLLEPLGLAPTDGPMGAGASKPPPGIELDKIHLQPGSVLSIPLAWGDMDLNAAGTVTDVLPNGQVLAFGHAMFGQGPLAVPMATGFVHLVLPSRQISFKMADSGTILGSVVRDEQCGIAGTSEMNFTTAPARIVVNMAGLKPEEYHYKVVQQKSMTPILAAILCMESLTSVENPPIENTGRISGDLVFTGHRTLHLDTVLGDMAPETILMQVMPALAVLAQNQHESMMLESMDLTMDVKPGLRVGSLANARLERGEVAPGEDARIVVRIQPYGKQAFDTLVRLPIPIDTAEGDYPVQVSDASGYLQALFQARPYLLNTTSGSELFAMVRKIMELPSDAIYVFMPEKPDGVAVGREALPNLPSSRRALLSSPTGTIATPYSESLEKIVPADYVLDGTLAFNLTVKKKPER